MKYVFSILFIILAGCTGGRSSSNSSSSSDFWSSEKAICKDKTKGTLVFREACLGQLSLAYTKQGDNFKKWCACVEEKLAYPFLLNEKCEMRTETIVVSLSNQDTAKVACGTPKDPR